MNTTKPLLRISSYFLFILIIACSEKSDSNILLKANDNDIKLEVDSVYYPELSSFTILLKITNYANKKAILVFDTVSDREHYSQARNLNLITSKDTFALKFNGTYLILKEHSITNYIACYGYFGYNRRGTFNSFEEIRTAFSNGKIEYDFNGKIPSYLNKEKLLRIADTFLIPYKLEAYATDTNRVVYDLEKKFHEMKSEKLTQ